MATKRMFSKEVLTDDWFTDMPMGAKLLYVYLSLEADDEGFISSAKTPLNLSGASKDDLRVLISKNYIMEMREGLYLIKHWKVNNYIQKDRIKESRFHSELEGLYLKEDGSYTSEKTERPAIVSKCSQTASKCLPSIEENSIEEKRKDKNSIVKKSIEEDNSELLDNETPSYDDFEAYKKSILEKNGYDMV